jgi:DNA-binding LacI/PurR family transcriptional regulator
VTDVGDLVAVADTAAAAGRALLRRPSLHDVALHAGVSHQTVSRVINDRPNVSPDTRARVQAAIDALGYRRNAAARILATNRSQTLGLMVQGEPRLGPASTMLGVAAAARDAGRYVSLAVVAEPSEQATTETLEYFRDQAVEGIVVIAPVADIVEVARAAASPSVPVVVVAAGERPRPGFFVASVDQQLGAALATRHLLELGHADVVHVTGPLDWHDAVERVHGWRAERAAWGLPERDPLVADWTSAAGYRIGRRLLAHAASGDPVDALPTAIFAANDQLALGLLRAFDEAGVEVPGRVSIVGYDDIEGADYFTPPLTTVRQPFEELGKTCIELLLAGMSAKAAGEVPERSAKVAPTLVVRATTAPPPRAQPPARRSRGSRR